MADRRVHDDENAESWDGVRAVWRTLTAAGVLAGVGGVLALSLFVLPGSPASAQPAERESGSGTVAHEEAGAGGTFDVRLRRAQSLSGEGRLERALEEYQAALEDKPADTRALVEAAALTLELGDRAGAIELYRRAWAADRGLREVADTIAWLLATRVEGGEEDVEEAVRLAERVCRETQRQVPSYLDTLAAAYAAAGRFEEAATTLEHALGLFGANASLRPVTRRCVERELEHRLGLYRSGKRFFDDEGLHLAWAREQYRNGSPLDAMFHLRRALRVQPDSPLSHARLADLLMERGRTGEAIRHYERALRLRPDWPEVANELAWILATSDEEGRRDPRRAIGLAEELVARTGRSVAPYLDTLAAAYAAAGRLGEAADAERRAVELAAGETDSASDERRLAAYRFRLGLYDSGLDYREVTYPFVEEVGPPRPEDLADAVLFLAGAHEDRPGWKGIVRELAWRLATDPRASARDGRLAVELLERVRRRGGPDEARTLDGLAAAYAEAGWYADAAALAARAARLAESDGTEARDIRARRELYAQELPYRQASEEGVLEQDASAGQGEAARWAGAIFRLGELLRRRGRIEAATMAYLGAVRRAPRHREAHLALAKLYFRSRRLAEADGHLRAALWLEREDAEMLARLGIVTSLRGRTGEAIRWYREALVLRPEWGDTANEVAWLIATWPGAEEADCEYAVRVAEELCRREGDVGHLDTLAAAYAAAGRFDNAVDTIERAIAVVEAAGGATAEPSRAAGFRLRRRLYEASLPYRGDREGHLELAKHFAGAGDRRAAEEELLRALDVAPGHPETLLYAGTFYLRVGRFAEGLAMLEDSLSAAGGQADVANELAWQYATLPDEELRNAERAVLLAERICQGTGYRRPAYLDTLAAAYAAAEQYEDAAGTLEHAEEVLRAGGAAGLPEELRMRKELYAAGRAYVQRATDGSDSAGSEGR